MRSIIKYIILAIINAGKVEKIRPHIIVIHCEGFIADRLMPDAIAAPLIPDMRAWLSLVGIPILQAINAHMTTAQSPAHRAGSAVSGVAERSAMPKTGLYRKRVAS